MSAFTKIGEIKIPFARGMVSQRYYNRLSVDFIAHNFIRASVRGIKIGKRASVYSLERKLTLPLTRRFNASEVT